MRPMHGGRIYEYAEQIGKLPAQIFDFSANINPLGPPQSVIDAIIEGIGELHNYPDSRQRRTKEEIAKRFRIEDVGTVFCGNGASEIIDLMIRNIRPRRVYIFEPAFSEYQAAARRNGATVVRVPLTPGVPLSVLIENMVPRPTADDIVIVNNPHNPTGRLWGRQELIEVVEQLMRHGVTVIVDESFMDFRPDGDTITLIPYVKDFRNVMIVRSATKMYAIPGIRFGFGVACREFVLTMEENRDNWSVNHLAQKAAIAAYQSERFVLETWRWLNEEQDYIYGSWGKHDAIRLYPPSVNYFLVQIIDVAIDPEHIYQQLVERNIFLRRCVDFQQLDNRHFRVAIKCHQDNVHLWETFSSLINHDL